MNPTPIPNPDERLSPWVQLKYYTFHPSVYPRMIGASSGTVRAGEAVHVYDRGGSYFGMGFLNTGARAPLRMFHHGDTPPAPDLLDTRLIQAVNLRRSLLGLDACGESYRVIHSDGDGLPGLVVDRYADVLAIEVTTLGVWNLLPRWVPALHALLGTRRARVNVDPEIARIERIRAGEWPQDDVRLVKFNEHGIRYEVDFSTGHKTGFFCDQRDNRHRLGTWTQGRRALDLCCYTGGFALAAKLLGKSTEVTAIDLDEKVIEQAKRNMNLNQTRLNLIHADAFSYARQMQKNGTTWPVIVLDPPKFITHRDSYDEGVRKYHDLNTLALTLAETGGLFVSCSCSGLLSAEDFEEIVIKAAHRAGKRLQILEHTGAGADHPVLSNCPESRYLKVLWATVW